MLNRRDMVNANYRWLVEQCSHLHGVDGGKSEGTTSRKLNAVDLLYVIAADVRVFLVRTLRGKCEIVIRGSTWSRTMIR